MSIGYIFEKEVAESLDNLQVESPLFYMKMVDTHAFDSLRKEGLILPKVPADYLIVYKGHAMFLECKSSRSKISYDLNWIKQHQIDSACDLEKAGATYYFLICNRSERNKFYILVLKPNTIRKLCAEPFATTRDNIKRLHSIRWDDLEVLSYLKINSSPESQRWELQPIFNGL